jgi:hypothetical protein
MQLFINNWSAVLTAPATASAVSLSVPLADAAKLIGLGTGDHYLLTLAEVDGDGLEIAWETIKVTDSAAGVLTVLRGQEGTTARDWDASAVISARVTKGTLEALRSAVVPPGAGGSNYLTRENFIAQVQNGALGIQSPIAIFARDNVGAYIFSADGGALKAMLPWLTTTLVKGLVAVGPYRFRGDNVAGIVVDSNSLVALSTGASADSSSSAEIFANALVSNASEVADGSFVSAPVRAQSLSGGAQQYILSVDLTIPPYGAVSFRYGSDYSESVWSVWWLDATNSEQSVVTSRALSITGMSYLSITISGGNMVCKVDGITVHTIPLANLYKEETLPAAFGIIVNVYKVTGNTPILIGLGTPSGQLILNPA